VDAGHVDRVQLEPGRGVDDPGLSAATRTARSSGTPWLVRRSRRPSNASSSRPDSTEVSSPITRCTGSRKWSTVSWESSGDRRLVISQREARSTRVRISIRIRVCRSAGIVLSQRVSSSRRASEPKISRATKLARVRSAALAPVSPACRGQ
jgi:hypothetical protein